MTLFAALRGAQSVSPRNANLESPLVPISGPEIVELFGPGAGSAGVVVTEERSIGLSAVWSAVNLLAGTIGSLPCTHTARTGRAAAGAVDPPVCGLARRAA